jgi:hypothetical protein
MKLSEVKRVKTALQDYTIDELESFKKMVIDTAIAERPVDGGECQLLVTSGGHYVLLKDDELVGWVKLGARIVAGKSYATVLMTFVVPKFRATKLVALLLLAVRQEVDGKLLVDGDLFPDGLKLIIALTKRKIARAYLLNKGTGARTDLSASKLDDDHAVVLESSHALWSDHSISSIPHIYSSYLFEDGAPGFTVKHFRYLKT